MRLGGPATGGGVKVGTCRPSGRTSARLAHHDRGVRGGRRRHAEDRPPAGDGLRPIARRHREARIDAGQHARREARRIELAERLVGVVQHAVEGAGRRLAGDGVIERGREAVDVGPRPLLGRGHLLGRGIARREDRRQRRAAPRHRRARRAEIDQGGIAGGIEQDVGGLDVAMQEAGIVDLLQAVKQRPQHAVDLLGRELAAAVDALLERLAAQQLHHDIGRAVGLEEVEDVHDRRHAMKAGQRSSLGDETLATPAEIVGHLGVARQHRRAVLADCQRRGQVFLDRDLAAELDVAGAIGDAEAALAQHRHDLVAADRLAGLKRHVVDLGYWRDPGRLARGLARGAGHGRGASRVGARADRRRPGAAWRRHEAPPVRRRAAPCRRRPCRWSSRDPRPAAPRRPG